MKRAFFILAAYAATLIAAAAPVRTATETFVTNKIAQAVAAIPAPDYSTNNTALVETIEATSPSPGDYANVSNKAVNALSRAEAEAGFTEWNVTPTAPSGKFFYISAAYHPSDNEYWICNVWLCSTEGEWRDRAPDADLFPLSDHEVSLSFRINGVLYTATRTRLPTMADLVGKANTNDVQLTPQYSNWSVSHGDVPDGMTFMVEESFNEDISLWIYDVLAVYGGKRELWGAYDSEYRVNEFSVSGQVDFDGVSASGTLHAIRSIIGYTLGSQSDKPLQPKGDYAPATNITKSALAQDVQTSLGKADTALQTAPVASVNGKTGAVSLTASDVGAVPTAGGTMTGQLIVPMLAVGRFYQAITATEDLDGAHVEICGRWFFEDFSGSRITCRDGMETKSVAFLSDIPSVAGLAPLNSPAFTGTPTAPTPASGDNSTKVATTAFVQAAISGISVTPLDGQTFDFATTQGVMDALKTVIETLGGTVINAPTLPAQNNQTQGE